LADAVPTMDTVDSGSTSEAEDQTKAWGSDAGPTIRPADDVSSSLPQSDCGIGHRVVASRSVLALVIDEECVFAGLQGGDIVVCLKLRTVYWY
jgi:di- and tripeptidase